ncbi:Clavaminate synthase-like protein [Westerdykella ornata]|uniref:Clavaminate synthase-like protein n=1 Tax=Westerdykella ornata TaxID=318751 RepID=A0A6A6JT67_WESOR|nr:Clavaminate synthase-like protein [Westerdykella ornata]KAF2279313.1 Clavaminate synthase-like protein [Westerdykella ornata]
MAPHADDSLDGSGYTPSAKSIAELKRKLHLHHAASLPGAAWITDCPQMNDSQAANLESKTLQLSLDDLKEIEDAYAYFDATGLPLNKLQAEHFPLPTLSRKLRQRSILLADKEPFFIIRGLKPLWFSKWKNVVIYTGIASHVGSKRAWAVGDPNVLHHVTNLQPPKEKGCEAYRGPANRNTALPFHTDYGSILSFYVLSKAQTGGDTYLADIHDIVSEISKDRPDIIETLRQPIININAKAEGAYDERPLLFTLSSGQLAVQASRSRLFGTQCRHRPSSLPPLSNAQVEAIDALHAAGQAVSQRIPSRSGDMIFFNNLRMMHARDAFVDGDAEENETSRYLLRLILHDERPDARWEIPPALKPTWDELYAHADEDEVFAIHPELFSYKAAH